MAKEFFAVYRNEKKSARNAAFAVLVDMSEAQEFLKKTSEENTPSQEDGSKPPKNETKNGEQNFPELISQIFEIFLALYDTIPNIRSIASVLPQVILNGELKNDLKSVALNNNQLAEGEIYTVALTEYDRVMRHMNRINSIQRTNRFIDRFFILGLVSLYDQFVRSLANHLVELKPHCIVGPDKTIKMIDLLQYKTIEEAREAFKERELDRLLRSSHMDQFSWFQEKLGVAFEPAIELKKRFVELCERRNLFAHTGGKVSQQYLEECRKSGVDIENIYLGQELKASRKYFVMAVETVIEIATQLVHVIWQKTDGKESTGAARTLINITFNLIRDRKYELAVKLIEFILDNKATSTKLDLATKRVHLVNHANALKLSGKEEFLGRLNLEDWSSMSLKEEVCLLAVRGDDEKLLILLPKAIAAQEINAGEFRTWPVFEPIRKSESMLTKVQSLFGEPLIEQINRRVN